MTKNIALKIATFVVLSIFIFALGVSSFAKMKEPDGINWSYLGTCSYSFDLTSTTSTQKHFFIDGTTTTGAPRNAYVKVELQKYINAGWNTIYTLTDEDYMAAGVEDTDYSVDKNYTYRLKITHKAKTTSGTTLETYTHYSYTL
ncbi:MAG: hypothetical protein IJ220_06295 [Clostridia bacterium]|nr:hypothetical protein [Clostridia bacterium]